MSEECNERPLSKRVGDTGVEGEGGILFRKMSDPGSLLVWSARVHIYSNGKIIVTKENDVQRENVLVATKKYATKCSNKRADRLQLNQTKSYIS